MATSKYTCLEDAELHAPLLKPYDHREGKRLAILRNLGRKMMESSIVVAMSMVCKKVGGVVMKDTAKTIHALKMAVALLLAFLLVLLRVPYEQLGENTIWAIMTVIVVFEFTIGATLSKGLNRGVGTLLAASLAVGVGELADRMSGGVGYPILIGFFVFLIACVKEYLRGAIHERFSSKFFAGKTVDNPLYDGYRSSLASASKEESLAGFASWEPPHGQFKVFKYPWNQYVKVGAVLRHCAYSVVALHGCLQSAIQEFYQEFLQKRHHNPATCGRG